jgi:hypothetical protein
MMAYLCRHVAYSRVLGVHVLGSVRGAKDENVSCVDVVLRRHCIIASFCCPIFDHSLFLRTVGAQLSEKVMEACTWSLRLLTCGRN